MSRHILLPSMIVLVLITTGIGSYAWVSHHRLPQSPGPVEKITLGTDRSLLSAPIWLAEHQGYFRDAGLEVTIKEFQTGRSALLAILHGEPIDIITVASTPIMLESFGRDDFRIIATSVDSQDNDKVIAHKESGIVTVADLLGKKIGYVKGTSAHFLLEILLVEHGLVPSQVAMVDLTPGDIPTALAHRDVDAVAIWEPYATQISDQRDTAQTIVTDRLGLDRAIVAKLWEKLSYRLFLDQLFLLDLESQARWAIKSQLTDKTVVPNYLHLISSDGLQRVNPKAVTLILPQN